MSPRGAKKNQEIRIETKAKIVKAALKVFAERGFQGASITLIASEAGLSHGIVYHYFVSKDAIFRELVDIALETSIEGVNQALSLPGSAWEKITNLSRALAGNAIKGESSYFFYIMIQAMTQGKSIPGLLEHIQERSGEYFRELIPLIGQAQAEGKVMREDPVKLAASYYALIQGLALNNLQNPLGAEITSPEIISNLLKA
jgi:AcrR family transcriptional regulator